MGRRRGSFEVLQTVPEMDQIGGERRFDYDLFGGGGGPEGDAVGVEEEAAAESRLGLGAVEGVADDRVADAGEVNADLVGAASADADFEEGELRVAAEDAVRAPSGAAFGEACGHADPAHGVAGDGALDAAGLILHGALDQRQVNFFDFAGGELRGEIPVRGVVLGDQEDAAGEAVEAVDNAGAQIAAELGEGVEAMEEGVDERAGVNASSGVDDHAGGFIDGDDGGIFVEDMQGNIFGRGFERREIGGFDVDGVAGAESLRGTGGGMVDEGAAGLDPLLNAGAAVFGKLGVEPLIETAAGASGVNGELH